MSSESGLRLTTLTEEKFVQAMQISQTKHTMPVVKSHKQLIGSGVNKTMAFMISDDFAFKAKEDGVIEKIDTENDLALLQYKSGKRDAIDLSEVFVKNSNSGFFIKQRFLINYKEGEKFTKGDVIAYNPSFFDGKAKNIDYKPGTFAKVAISPIDLAYEDSTVIAESLSKNAASFVTMVKPVVLGQNAVIHKMSKIGDKINAGESMLDFTTSFDDPSTSDFLAKLARDVGEDISGEIGSDSITAKYSGTIANIKIYYNVPLDDLSDSLKKLIRAYKGKVDKRKKVLGDIKSSNLRIPPTEQQKLDKVGQTKYEGVLVEFYVEYEDNMEAGDKLTFNTALKAVIARTLSVDEAPLSEYREDEHVEAVLTPTGIISRMTSDVYLMLYGNKVLIELGKQIKEIMNDER